MDPFFVVGSFSQVEKNSGGDSKACFCLNLYILKKKKHILNPTVLLRPSI